MNKEEIENKFTYHAPTPGQPEIYQVIRDQAKHVYVRLDTFEECVVTMTPPSEENQIAISKIAQAEKLVEEAVFWANASIARHPLAPQPDPNTLYPDVLTTSQAEGSSSVAHMTDEPEFQGTRRLHYEEDDTP